MKHNGKTSRAELRAIIAIAIILVLVISFPTIQNKFFPVSTDLDTMTLTDYPIGNSDQSETNYFHSADKPRYTPRNYPYKSQPRSHGRNSNYSNKSRQNTFSHKVNCQSFDPNTVTSDELIAMGINNYVSNNLIKFRQSGAIFRKPDDIRKIYGMDSTLFITLESCIAIQPENRKSEYASRSKFIDINTAAIEDWKSLPGIGEVLATRIVKYREVLGGFHIISQVGETYGLPPETFAQISAKLVMSSGPKKLDINTATIESLAAHPYITQKQAETIVNYRDHHGKFTQIEDVLKIYSLQNTWLERMQPYLACHSEAESVEDLVAR
jgi:competence ComEA-like helix-hairpin-helix protein